MNALRRESGLVTRSLSGMAWTSLAVAIQTVVQVVLLVALSRLLSPAEFGLVSLALIVVGFSELLMSLGVAPAIIKTLVIEPRHIGTAFVTSLVMAGVWSLVIIFSAESIAALFRQPNVARVLQVVAISILFRGASGVGEALLQRDLRFRALSIARTASFIVGYAAVALLLALAGYGAWALAIAALVQSILHAAIVTSMTRHRVSLKFDAPTLRELLGFGSGITAANVVNFFRPARR